MITNVSERKDVHVCNVSPHSTGLGVSLGLNNRL